MFMNDEHSPETSAPMRKRILDERLADSVHVDKRVQRIVDLMEQALAQGFTADEAEKMALEQVNKFGNDMWSDRAIGQEKASLDKAKHEDPNASVDT
jgi:hypothetical protein